MGRNTPSPNPAYVPVPDLPAASVDGPPPGPVGVRIAGLPTLALDHSRIPVSTELALRTTALDQRLTAEAAQLSDSLYALIGTEPARPFKARLVGLRRAVHRGARIDALLDTAAPPDVLGGALTERLHQHAALRRTRADVFAELGRVLPSETRSAAKALASLIHDPAFAAGLDYASPDLYEDLLRWSERDAPTRRPLDGAAVRLAKYAGRAMVKPSPLTTFAAGGFGRWAASTGVGVHLERSGRAEVAEVSLLPLSRIATALAHVPELAAAVQLRVNPSATVASTPEGERWLFTAPGPSGEVRTLPATPALAAIMAAATEAGSPGRLRSLLGATAPGSGADSVIARLVRLGLLEVRIGLPDQELDAATLWDWLDRHLPEPVRGNDGPARLLCGLRAVRDRIDTARGAAPGSHRSIATSLRHHLTDVAKVLQLIPTEGQLDSGSPYFHHTVAVGTAAVLDPAVWRPALADLAVVPGLLAPFDTLRPARVDLCRHAVTAYGPGFTRSFTQFLHDFGGWWAAAGSGGPTERDARRQDELRRLIAATPPSPDGTVRLDPQAVGELCGDWPDPENSPDGQACYVQTLTDPSAERGLGLVLNTVTGGHGTGLTRTARLLDAPAGFGTPGGERGGDDPAHGALYAELDGTFGSALNQRVDATRYAIDLDGTTSHRPPEQLIRPAELDVVHDARAQRLHLIHRPTGRRTRPVHLGLLATPLLPLQARLLVGAFGQTSYTFWSDWPQLWRLLPSERVGQPREDLDVEAGGGRWRKLPRLALGSVVLRRASWFLDAGRAPARGAGESDAAHLVRVHTWRAALGLPQRCFLRVLTPRPADGFTGPALHDKDRKPVYIDFAHAHLLRVFERAAASGRPLLLTEALPDLHHAPAHPDGHRYATEFVIEIPSTATAHRRARPC
ncbi:lantibiotic dehydratase [Streptomyces sp. SID1034]|uniref:lantibiotic dehydratase n=1 Tax=Streptomyces sp. SID1034 TaxID=2690248 RepID=UPI0013717A7D|nr:lantibiotic dehydratase [Streptomyces sp. SID1034]